MRWMKSVVLRLKALREWMSLAMSSIGFTSHSVYTKFDACLLQPPIRRSRYDVRMRNTLILVLIAVTAGFGQGRDSDVAALRKQVEEQAKAIADLQAAIKQL